MVIQGVVFAIVYQALIAPMAEGWLLKAAAYAALGGVLSWSFTTIAVAGEVAMASISDMSSSRAASPPSSGSSSAC